MLAELNANYPLVLSCFALALGACWGSFLNVVVYRLPLGKSIVYPGSTCTTCGKAIRFYDNIPVLSWLILRGKSRCCQTPFSVRYPLVEAVTALLFLACWHAYGPEQWGVVLVGWALISLLLSGALIDYDTQMLPDIFTVWGMVIGVALSMLVPALHGLSAVSETVTSVYGVVVETSVHEPPLLLALRGGLHAAIGAIVGAGTLLWIAILAEAVLRKEAMGFGDVLLMGCIGAFCGWQGALFAIFGGALIGCVGVVVIALLNKIFGFKLSAGKTSVGGPAGQAEATSDSGGNVQPGSETLPPANRSKNANAQLGSSETHVLPIDSETHTRPEGSKPHPQLGNSEARSQQSNSETTSAAQSDDDLPSQNASTQPKSATPTEAPQLGFGVAIPFGPWLAAGALVYFLFLREPTAAYIANLSDLFFPR